MRRVERHIILNDKNLDNLCFLSKNLYNYVNYLLRQEFTSTGNFPSEYDITTALSKEKQPDYIALPAQTSQQIIKILFKNWKSFFKLCKCKDKLKGKPHLPKYKHKSKGRNIVVFTNQQCKLKDGFIHFPKRSNIKPLKTNVSNICQVRIIPQNSCFVIEVVYNKQINSNYNFNPDSYLSLDLGLNNLITSFDSFNYSSFIINGRISKAINQFFNKKKATLISYIGDKGTSNRINKLSLKRNNKITDYLHKTSRFIINYCIEYHISTIVIGNNKDWKQNINLGRRTNQNFVSIPFEKLISQIKYKAEEIGIKVIVVEESYTSKVDHFALEEMCKHESYKGKRAKRGLFMSSTNKILNADLNGALGILRKVVGESLFKRVINRGDVATPSRVSFV